MIRVLPPEVADKIAAGEVVERPASVAKELVENAIDAGAAHIKVEVQEAGKRLIGVTDNGSGTPADEIDLSPAQVALWEQNGELLARLGFAMELLGEKGSAAGHPRCAGRRRRGGCGHGDPGGAGGRRSRRCPGG